MADRLVSRTGPRRRLGQHPDGEGFRGFRCDRASSQVDGGVRVTGRWHYNTGSWHAQWAVLGIPITDIDGEIVDQGLALIPCYDLEFEETWFAAGMRSAGSNCLIADDVFVPGHRILSLPLAIHGIYGTELTDAPLYRSALVPVQALALVGPQLGLGRKALQLVKEQACAKPISYTYYTAQSDSVGFQLQLAEAAMLIDTAHLHAYPRRRRHRLRRPPRRVPRCARSRPGPRRRRVGAGQRHQGHRYSHLRPRRRFIRRNQPTATNLA